MADETLKYNIEFDRAGLAEELSSIRDQIDFALGQSSMQNAPVPLAADLTSFMGSNAGQVTQAAMGTIQPNFAPQIPDNFAQQADSSF